MKKLLLNILVVLAFFLGASGMAMAVVDPGDGGGGGGTDRDDVQQQLIDQARACEAGDTSQCVGDVVDPAAKANCQAKDSSCNIVNRYVNPFINILAVMVGISVTIGIIWGGIQYAASAGDPQKAATARMHIRNSIIALLVFFFLYALLAFLIPGKGLLVR